MRSTFGRVGIQGLGVFLGLVLAAPVSAATVSWVSPGTVATAFSSLGTSGFLLPGDTLRLAFDWTGTQVLGDGSVRPEDGSRGIGRGLERLVLDTPLGSFSAEPGGSRVVIDGGELTGVTYFARFDSILCDGSVRPGAAGLLPSFVIQGDGSVRALPGDGSVTPDPGVVQLADGSVRICDGSVRLTEVSFSFNETVLGTAPREWFFGNARNLYASGFVSSTPQLAPVTSPQPIPLPPALPLLAAGLLALAGLSRRRG
jgi:hypothetical protein